MGLNTGMNTSQARAEDRNDLKVDVDHNSDRLQLLDIFNKLDGCDIEAAADLTKARGKCTTDPDHISMVGSRLKIRGHLDNISNNCIIGGINDANGKETTVASMISCKDNGRRC